MLQRITVELGLTKKDFKKLMTFEGHVHKTIFDQNTMISSKLWIFYLLACTRNLTGQFFESDWEQQQKQFNNSFFLEEHQTNVTKSTQKGKNDISHILQQLARTILWEWPRTTTKTVQQLILLRGTSNKRYKINYRGEIRHQSHITAARLHNSLRVTENRHENSSTTHSS